jgi:hypothetical protein
MIGSSAYGQVILAYDYLFQRKVAIKQKYITFNKCC